MRCFHIFCVSIRRDRKQLAGNVTTDMWVRIVFQWLTNTAVVVVGQLVTCVALTVVWALGVYTSVHAVVAQGALVSVCRYMKTQAGRFIRKKQLIENTPTFSKVRWDKVRAQSVFVPVAYRHSGLRFSGNPEDTGTWRSLWCCSTSVQAHNCVCLLHIHLHLQQTCINTERELHKVNFHCVQRVANKAEQHV